MNVIVNLRREKGGGQRRGHQVSVDPDGQRLPCGAGIAPVNITECHMMREALDPLADKIFSEHLLGSKEYGSDGLDDDSLADETTVQERHPG